MKEITACYGHFNGQDLDGVNCIDFLPDVQVTNKSDMKILRTWQTHFQAVGTPYIIERVGNILKLWKRSAVQNLAGCVMGVLVNPLGGIDYNGLGHSCRNCGHFQKDGELCPNCGTDPTRIEYV